MWLYLKRNFDCVHKWRLKDFHTDGTFKFLPMEVNFYPYSMAKILVIKDVASIPGVHISINSRKENVIIVEYQNHIIKFQECCDGLYYYDTANDLFQPKMSCSLSFSGM